MLEIGQILHDKYRVDRLVGRGGMGEVFEGVHLLVGRRVAIKVLLPEVASSEDGSTRFEREVRAAARIGNDHILDVFDAGALPDGARFMVSEFLDGDTLEARLKRGTLSTKQTAILMLELLDGLAAAHRAGIVHRDLKPDNIFLTRKSGREDFVKIIDFGVSKFQFDEQAMSMTTTGAVLGTPYYLSPEQARGDRDIDPRSDLYTVGVIVYRCVAGGVPFQADSFQSLLFKIALEDAEPLARAIPGLDPAFSALVQRAMARERAARFQSADEMREAFQSWLAGPGRAPQATSHAQPVAGWDGSETLAAPTPIPTSSNFGRTSPVLRARQQRSRAWLALGGVLLLASVGAGALLFLRGAGTETHAATSAVPSPLAAPVTQTAPTQTALPQPAPSATAPEEPPPTFPSPNVEPEPNPTPPANEPSAPRLPAFQPARTSPQRRLSSPKPERPAATVEPTAPKPSTTGHARRDFGY
jgi:serine/threonine-protein kinase